MANTNGAWVDGVFFDGINVTAADLNANNQWLLAQANAVLLPNQPNTWGSPQTFTAGIVLQPSTVAALPTPPTDGMRAQVTDAAALTFGAAVTGGGALHGPVYYDGSAHVWKAG